MRSGTILYVEDNPDDVDLTLQAFKEVGFKPKIVVVKDGREALDYLFGTGAYAGRDKQDTPVLVLLDLNLPRLSGLEVLRRMKDDPQIRHVTVIVLTSSNHLKDREETARLGTNLYIQKPVNFDEFTPVVQTIKKIVAAVQ